MVFTIELNWFLDIDCKRQFCTTPPGEILLGFCWDEWSLVTCVVKWKLTKTNDRETFYLAQRRINWSPVYYETLSYLWLFPKWEVMETNLLDNAYTSRDFEYLKSKSSDVCIIVRNKVTKKVAINSTLPLAEVQKMLAKKMRSNGCHHRVSLHHSCRGSLGSGSCNIRLVWI